MGRKRRYSKAYKKAHPLTSIYLLPVLFIIAIVPLIVYAKFIELDGLEAIYWKGGNYQFDFFHYYKSIYFIIASYIGALIVLILYWLDKLDFVKTSYYKPMGVYVLFVFLSFLFADDIDVALRGYIEMFQGVFVLIGYILLLITIINLVRHEKHLKVFIGAFIFVGLGVGLIGVGQYFGQDLFRTEFGQLLILPKEFHALADQLRFSFADFAVYATLYNTNFVGSFAALLIPFSFALYFYQKRAIYAIITILFVGLMVFVGFGSNSRAGIIGVIAALLLIAIIFRKEAMRKPIYIIIPFISLLVVGYGLNEISDGRIINEFKNLSIKKDLERAEERAENRVYFKEIVFDDYHAEIVTEEKSLQFDFVQNELNFYDLDGTPLETTKEGRRVTFNHASYADYIFTRSEDGKYYNVRAYGRSFNIWLTIDGFKFEGLSGDLFDPVNPDKIKFLETYGSLFSSRTFIWSRSIPMLKKHLLIGAGPDMFPIAFPQDDFAGKLNFMGIRTVVDKPHNMYLQMGVNTGVISLGAMLTLFGLYLSESFKLFINRKFETLSDYIGAGLFASVTAYLISGFFNDQIISVAPIFYAMLGLGIAINLMIKESEKEETV
ncbi:MAG: O-antigen ligase family protein, partial [Candidatus Izimaplasma sp.]|nr:O-antigen ligase family protein [Candidatus Izimaplasma bacterium]